MRHQKHRHSLGVKKEHRSALLANLASSLIKHGRIRTTTAKAKALRPFVERIVTLAKKGDIHRRRLALSRLRDESAVTKLFNERSSDFSKREGGYTRIYKLAEARLGDAADMAIIEFVGAGDEGYKKAGRRKARSTKAKGARKSKAAAEVTPTETTPAAESPKSE